MHRLAWTPVAPFAGAALAWRQHDGGHTDAPDPPHFRSWAERVPLALSL